MRSVGLCRSYNVCLAMIWAIRVLNTAFRVLYEERISLVGTNLQSASKFPSLHVRRQPS